MEWVGTCVSCGTNVYCRDGFLDGVSENGRLFCHRCYGDREDGEPSSGPKTGRPEERFCE